MYTLNTCLLSVKHFMWMTIIYNECMISHELIFFVFTLVEGVCQTAHLSSMIQVDISVRGRQWMSILVWRSALWTAPELSLDPTTEMNSTWRVHICIYLSVQRTILQIKDWVVIRLDRDTLCIPYTVKLGYTEVLGTDLLHYIRHSLYP